MPPKLFGEQYSSKVNNVCGFAHASTKAVNQEVPGRRAGYVSIANENDATCIAWITVQQFDGTQGGAWTGDIGNACGADWYNSVEPAGRLKEEQGGSDYIPKCTWIDGDHTNDIEEAALKFDLSAYGEGIMDTIGKDACAPTIFGTDQGPISDKPGGKRSTRERPAWITGQLIISNFTSQPAEELCSSATSWGPDFIGSDGMFSDMDSKILTPLCRTRDVAGCVEVDETAGNLVKRMSIARRATDIVHRSYKNISKWGY